MANLSAEERRRTGQNFYSCNQSYRACARVCNTACRRSVRSISLGCHPCSTIPQMLQPRCGVILCCGRRRTRAALDVKNDALILNREYTRESELANTGPPEASIKGSQCADALGSWWERSGELFFAGSVLLGLEPSSMSTRWSQVEWLESSPPLNAPRCASHGPIEWGTSIPILVEMRAK